MLKASCVCPVTSAWKRCIRQLPTKRRVPGPACASRRAGPHPAPADHVMWLSPSCGATGPGSIAHAAHIAARAVLAQNLPHCDWSSCMRWAGFGKFIGVELEALGLAVRNVVGGNRRQIEL